MRKAVNILWDANKKELAGLPDEIEIPEGMKDLDEMITSQTLRVLP